MFDLGGQIVLVTGASRGIGRAIGLELGRAGAEIAAHYHVNRAGAESLCAELGRIGVAAKPFPADVGSWEETARMVRAAGDWRGRLDGVVTCAGIFRGDDTEGIGAKDFESVLRVDLEGSFRTIQCALPYLRKSVRPAIVTVSSVLASHPAVGGAPYQAAKGGLEQMTRALALELAPRIRVNAVAPGFIRTDMNRTAHEDPRTRESIAKATPLGRWGEPADVAPAVRYLLSLEADWVTGLVLGIDGGIPMSR